VNAAGSVTNQTDQRQRIRLAITLVGPGGVVYDASKNVVLAPHEAVDSAWSIPVLSGYATGVYTLTVSAGNAGGTSSASASIELY
jgi:uncharacterized protein YfaS (alpha-2-macroglobulin family)